MPKSFVTKAVEINMHKKYIYIYELVSYLGFYPGSNIYMYEDFSLNISYWYQNQT